MDVWTRKPGLLDDHVRQHRAFWQFQRRAFGYGRVPFNATLVPFAMASRTRSGETAERDCDLVIHNQVFMDWATALHG